MNISVNSVSLSSSLAVPIIITYFSLLHEYFVRSVVLEIGLCAWLRSLVSGDEEDEFILNRLRDDSPFYRTLED